MGKLAELAGTKKLRGAVQVTCLKTGMTRTCKDEDQALEVIGTADVEHRRGAFFYGAASPAPAAKKAKKKVAARRAPAEDPIG